MVLVYRYFRTGHSNIKKSPTKYSWAFKKIIMYFNDLTLLHSPVVEYAEAQNLDQR